MYFLNKEKINFVLHDCCIDSIESTDFGLSLNFKKGIYIANDNSDYKLSGSCKLELNIEDFKGNEDYHVSIVMFKKSKKVEISFVEFISKFNNFEFQVYLDFYSDFAKAICIKGNLKNIDIEIIITEIKDLNIRF